MKEVTILIPTYNRPTALVATLTSLASQTYTNFDVVVSNQGNPTILEDPSLKTVGRILQKHNNHVKIINHFPRKGMAEQRAFLLQQATSPYCLFLDDDVVLEPFVLELMVKVIKEQHCGLVGSAVQGLSFLNDLRPQEQTITFWEGRVMPEKITPGSSYWQRHKVHNAANLLHIQQKLEINYPNYKIYKIAWVGGCVLYDTQKLKTAGGFSFWKQLPDKHVGEDALAQIHVIERFGGCGVLPSGAYHQELPTTIAERKVNAPEFLKEDYGGL